MDSVEHLSDWLKHILVPVPPETPKRIEDMYCEFFIPPHQYEEPPFDFKMFPNDEGFSDLVMVKNIHFFSMCEHHLIPFFGNAHVGYLPHERIVGLSKIPRVVDWYARRPQLQERMTAQIADYLREQLRPKGVIVVIEAQHLCVAMRGIKSINAVTVTSALRGTCLANPDARQEFFQLIGR